MKTMDRWKMEGAREGGKFQALSSPFLWHFVEHVVCTFPMHKYLHKSAENYKDKQQGVIRLASARYSTQDWPSFDPEKGRDWRKRSIVWSCWCPCWLCFCSPFFRRHFFRDVLLRAIRTTGVHPQSATSLGRLLFFVLVATFILMGGCSFVADILLIFGFLWLLVLPCWLRDLIFLGICWSFWILGFL